MGLTEEAIERLVQEDTAALIHQADTVVSQCTGPNCATSPQTRQKITSDLAAQAVVQNQTAQKLLELSPSAVGSRQLYQGYLDLASAVSTVYSYQCGDRTTQDSCVSQSKTVEEAQRELEAIMAPLVKQEQTRLLTTYILGAAAGLFFLLFLLFLIFGFFFPTKKK